MAGKLRPLFAGANSVMEPGGVAAVESSWSALNSATAAEESELMAQFIASHSLSNEQDDEPSLVMQSLFWSDHTIESCYGSQEINTNTYYWPMESGCNFSSCSYSNKQASDYESCYNSMESNMISAIELRSEPVVFYMKEEENANTSHRFDCRLSVKDCEGAGEPGTHDIKKLKGKRKIQVCEPAVIESPAVSPKKKARSSSQAGKGSKRLNCKKSEKESGNTSPAVQSSSSCSSEDETNVSKEFTSMSPKGSVSLNSNGKTRAGRGSATDPQSLYARKRRERINERLRILQNLVPNGTKVDISTMLEEAVQYVKFLQVQIKLLSSDELWMYAPIAYGMNIGIDLKISPS